jgi:hypothetical protein
MLAKLLGQNPEALPNVTKVNTRHRLEVLQGTQPNHECMNTIVLTIDNQTSHQDYMGGRGREANSTRPVLGGCNGWGVDDEFIRLLVDCGCSLNATNMCVVTESVKFSVSNCPLLDEN